MSARALTDKMQRKLLGAQKPTAIRGGKRHKRDGIDILDSAETVDKCLHCGKAECTNCIGQKLKPKKGRTPPHD